MMDRPSTSTNPLFLEQDGDMSSFVTKNQLFGAQRALHQEQLALGDRIDNLATDLRQSEQRTRDYFDTYEFPQRTYPNHDSPLFYFVIIKTEPLKSTLRRHHLRFKYTDIKRSPSCRPSRSSSKSQSST